MVKINNQRKAFLKYASVSEELITDVRKPEIMVMTSLWAEAIYSYSLPLANLSLNPKLKSTGADATSFFPVGGIPTSSLAWKTYLESQDAARIAAD